MCVFYINIRFYTLSFMEILILHILGICLIKKKKRSVKSSNPDSKMYCSFRSLYFMTIMNSMVSWYFLPGYFFDTRFSSAH